MQQRSHIRLVCLTLLSSNFVYSYASRTNATLLIAAATACIADTIAHRLYLNETRKEHIQQLLRENCYLEQHIKQEKEKQRALNTQLGSNK